MAQAVSDKPNIETHEQAKFEPILANRDFLQLWIAQIISQLAQQMINFALLVQVGDLSNSGTATAAIIICFTIPAILFSAVAGVFVDRHPKRRVLVLTNITRGLVMLAYVLTVLLPHLDTAFGLITLYIATLIFSAICQFFVPAEAAMIPLLVRRERLIAANSLFNLTFTAAQLVGFAFLGPLLVGLIGYKWLYIVIFAAYALCAYLTWRLPEKEAGRTHAPDRADTWGDKIQVAWDDFKAGWKFIQADPSLTTAIVYWSISIAVFMMLGAIGVKFLTNVLHVDPSNLYFLMVPGGVGLVLGVVVVGRVSTEQNRAPMINYSLLLAGAVLLLLGLTHPSLVWGAALLHQPEPPIILSQVIMGAFAFLLGVVNSFISVPAQTVLQERAPEEIRARVFGAFYTVSNAILIVPIMFAGGMADLLGPVQTVVLIALLVLVVAGGGLWYGRRHLSPAGVR
jgi:MFS family permease